MSRRNGHSADEPPRGAHGAPDADGLPFDPQLEAQLDALLDGELDADARRALFERLAPEDRSLEAIAATREVLTELRLGPAAPDLSERILGRVEQRRRFLSRGWRRFVTTGRAAVAAGILIGIGLTATAQRLWPEATTLEHRPTPLTGLVDSTRADAMQGFEALGRTLGQAPVMVADRLGDALFPSADAMPARPVMTAPAYATLTLGPRADAHDRAAERTVEISAELSSDLGIDLAAVARYLSCSSSLWPTGACDTGPSGLRVVAAPETGLGPIAVFHVEGADAPLAFPLGVVEVRSPTFNPGAILRGGTGLRVLEIQVPAGSGSGRCVLVARWTPPSGVVGAGDADHPDRRAPALDDLP